MRYIESEELREWVKENLRKAIFQKAHALAIQTGIDVLVKLHDTRDIAGCQYYGTTNLKRLYRSSKLRQPGEMMVSGETGLPHRDRSTQSGDVEEADGEESGHLMDVTADAVESELELSAANTQTQENQFDSLSHEAEFDTNDLICKTEPIEMDHQEQFETPVDDKAPKKLELSDVSRPLSAKEALEIRSLIISRATSGSTSNMHHSAVPISPKPYQCSICQKTFRSIQILQKHTLTFHSRPKTTVKLAKGRGKGRGGVGHGSQFFRHHPQQQDDLEPKGFHCIMCNHSFSTTDLLQNHVAQVHMSASLTASHEPSTSQEHQAAGSLDPSLIPPDFQTTDPQDPSITGEMSTPIKTEPGAEVTNPVSIAQFQSVDSPSSFDMSQGSPSAFNLSSASTSSLSSISSPRTGQRLTVSKVRDLVKWKYNRGNPTAKTNINQHVMEAILLTLGPVSTRTAVNTAGPRFLRGSISHQNFETACHYLEKANLGYLTATSYYGGKVNVQGKKVFIKKDPREVAGMLLQSLNLCTLDEYTVRYAGNVPKCIARKLCDNLVETGLVSRDKFTFAATRNDKLSSKQMKE